MDVTIAVFPRGWILLRREPRIESCVIPGVPNVFNAVSFVSSLFFARPTAAEGPASYGRVLLMFLIL